MKSHFPKIPVLTFVLLIFIFNAFGQNIWTLQDCVDEALENNILVKREKLNTIKQENNLQKQRLNLLPNLNAGYIHEYRSGYSMNELQYFYDDIPKNYGYMGLESEVELFSGLRNFNNLKKQSLLLEKSLSGYHETRNSIILNVASAYLEILLNTEILDMAKNQLEITSQQVERTVKLVEVGNLAKGELLKMQALEANERLSVVQAQNALHKSYLNLMHEMELDDQENIQIYIPELHTIGLFQVQEVEMIYNQALETLPEIRRGELDVSIMEQSMKITKGQGLPTLEFKSSLNSWYMVSSGDSLGGRIDQIGNQGQIVYGLDLQIPIFNKFSVSKEISNAKIDLLDAQYNLEQTKRELLKKIQQLHADALAAYDKYAMAEKAVEINEEAFKYSEQKFNAGLVTAVDYNMAKNELLKARAELLISKYEYIFTAKFLDFYSGKPFTI